MFDHVISGTNPGPGHGAVDLEINKEYFHGLGESIQDMGELSPGLE